MKRCTYCGKEYSDDAVVCAIDQEPLDSDQPDPSAALFTNSSASSNSIPSVNDIELPDGFIPLEIVDPEDAPRIIQRLQYADIHGIIATTEMLAEPDSRGSRKKTFIYFAVHTKDEERARKIIFDDCKV